ncbi:hypothetical protein YN1HA_3540 [Sulfurisphaera ohwakuensis]
MYQINEIEIELFSEILVEILKKQLPPVVSVHVSSLFFKG